MIATYPFLCFFLSLCISVSLCLCLFFSGSLSFSLSLQTCLILYPSIPLPLSLSSLTAPCLYFCSPSVSLSHHFTTCSTIYLSHSLCPCLSVSICSVSLCFCLSRFHFSFCSSTFLYLSPLYTAITLFVRLSLCVSLAFNISVDRYFTLSVSSTFFCSLYFLVSFSPLPHSHKRKGLYRASVVISMYKCM